MSSLVGRTLGQYEIVDVLGRGGMATVYLGRQASIDRTVAVKVLPPHPGLDEAFKERFQLEAKTIGSLQNPNILPLYDYGVSEDVIYLVMQHVEGGTLEDLIEMGPMDINKVEKIIRSIASGLDYAHNRGVVHRDIKPANILIQDGHPLLADFGMVKMVAGNSNLTGTAIVGTPSYMAPEQGQGLDVDHRVDVYALAAMAYEMLTGQQVFSGSSPMQMILEHIKAPIPDVTELRPDLNQGINDVMQNGLAKEPDNRYQSAGDFAEALSRAIHRNDETLAEVQKEFPIKGDNTTQQHPRNLEATINTGSANTISQQPTQVIVRDSVNPFILMGGFGLIALVIVVVAVFLINAGNDSNNDVAIITEVASDVPVNTPVPTVNSQERTFGIVSFSSANALGDRVEVRLQNAEPAVEGNEYAAWLLNTESGATVRFEERVIVDLQGAGTVTFTDPDGRMLVAEFDSVIITTETEIGDMPTGDIVYSGNLPSPVASGLKEIFAASENGLNGGSLLAGALAEASHAARHAGLAANATNIGGVRTHAEHTINILRGGLEDYDGNGSGSNPGEDVGIFFFMDAIDAILIEATSIEGVSSTLQSNAEGIRNCTQNIRDWSEQIISLELGMIDADDHEAIANEATESTILAEQITTGINLNTSSNVIEIIEGECGLNQIPDAGLLFGRMNIFEGNVNAEE